MTFIWIQPSTQTYTDLNLPFTISNTLYIGNCVFQIDSINTNTKNFLFYWYHFFIVNCKLVVDTIQFYFIFLFLSRLSLERLYRCWRWYSNSIRIESMLTVADYCLPLVCLSPFFFCVPFVRLANGLKSGCCQNNRLKEQWRKDEWNGKNEKNRSTWIHHFNQIRLNKLVSQLCFIRFHSFSFVFSFFCTLRLRAIHFAIGLKFTKNERDEKKKKNLFTNHTDSGQGIIYAIHLAIGHFNQWISAMV